MALIAIDSANVSDNSQVQIFPISEGETISFTKCNLTLLDWFEEKDGVKNLIKANVPTVVFADGRKIGLSKLTTHSIDGKPTRTDIGARVTAVTRLACEKQLQKLGSWLVSKVEKQPLKDGSETNVYYFEEIKG
jgi:hypothetical protein